MASIRSRLLRNFTNCIKRVFNRTIKRLARFGNELVTTVKIHRNPGLSKCLHRWNTLPAHIWELYYYCLASCYFRRSFEEVHSSHIYLIVGSTRSLDGLNYWNKRRFIDRQRKGNSMKKRPNCILRRISGRSIIERSWRL
jgi:hypothetical protein